jgi:predicted protein tyrosine phosphatase
MAERKRHYLFVCYANENRSPTAEAICRNIAEENGLEIDVSSAGLSLGANRPLTREMADKADRIFVMESVMKVQLEKEYEQSPGKVICLEIPDIYSKNDPWLIRILEDKLYEHFNNQGLLSW